MRKLIGALTAGLLVAGSAQAEDILVFGNDLNKYFSAAKPGDVFLMAPGDYTVNQAALLAASGTKEEPITIKPAGEPRSVRINVERSIGFKISGRYWTVEGLDFFGVCGNHSLCEHAFQIIGNGDNTVLRNNRMIDFNAAIKGNGIIEDGRQMFPDRVLIEKNQIYNRTPRQTGNPVTPIDVVGGRYWTIRENFIADFQKVAGDHVSYAAFLKGNSDNGLFERNLVICEWRHQGGVRLGLSFGGGGTTDPSYCQGRNCTIEHYNGTMRGNVIMNCPRDVGVYLNNAASTTLVNNTILNTAGVDVRFNGSFATMANNVIEGRIQGRDGGRFREDHNLVEKSLKELFPNITDWNIAPSDPEELEGTSRDFAGVDLCTGEANDSWKGAMTVPNQCSVREMLLEVIKDLRAE